MINKELDRLCTELEKRVGIYVKKVESLHKEVLKKPKWLL